MNIKQINILFVYFNLLRHEFQSVLHQFDKSVMYFTALNTASVELIGLSDLPSESLTKATGTE